jgi:NAD-dependent DNA ligase
VTEKQVEELIHRRRRQILVHSIIYYKYGESTIPVATFDSWAQELARLQKAHLQLSESIPYMRYAFSDFTGETGYHLPLMDERASRVAEQIMETYKKEQNV